METKKERIFINLTYLGNMDDVYYRMRRLELYIEPEEKLTWWNHYTIDEYLSSSKWYTFILSSETDSTKHDIIISFGRKLKYLYYYEKEYLSNPDWEMEGYRARPVFEEDFVQNSAYVYLIDKIHLADSEVASNDISEFRRGDIPFELPPEE